MAKPLKTQKTKTSVKRPLGASIVAVYFCIIGAIFIIGSISIFTIGLEILESLIDNPLFGALGSAIAFVILIIGILYLIIGYGLWKLKKWARIVATILAVVGLFGGWASLIFSLAIILLLWIHKETKTAFS